MTAPTESSPGADKKQRRARRPAAHFLGLRETYALLDTAWDLARADRSPRTYANALRVEIAIHTGLRIGELHNLRPSDIYPDGTLGVRMLTADDSPWGRGLKYAKPRITAWNNGLDESPTLALLREWIEDRGLGPEDRLWPSQPYAWWHWVVHRLGPASGLQRKLPKLDGNDADEGAPRYLIHPHAFRACFVMICRRYPRTIGGEPVPWTAICAFGGWDSVDTIQKNYYYADLDEHLSQLRASMGAGPAIRRAPIEVRTPRPPRPSERGEAA